MHGVCYNAIEKDSLLPNKVLMLKKMMHASNEQGHVVKTFIILQHDLTSSDWLTTCFTNLTVLLRTGDMFSDKLQSLGMDVFRQCTRTINLSVNSKPLFTGVQ